jgi:hypothetical protein
VLLKNEQVFHFEEQEKCSQREEREFLPLPFKLLKFLSSDAYSRNIKKSIYLEKICSKLCKQREREREWKIENEISTRMLDTKAHSL